MKARVQIELTFELANPEDYPEEVGSWLQAADSDLESLSIVLCDGQVEVTPSVEKVEIEGSDEFIRLEGDDQEGE